MQLEEQQRSDKTTDEVAQAVLLDHGNQPGVLCWLEHCRSCVTVNAPLA